MKNKINFLLDLNKKHSEWFLGQRLERDLYRANHPTNVVAFKCMDGRIHLPVITKTPLGIISPYRNIGGRFDLGWPLLNLSFDESVNRAVARGARTLVLVTYHYSKGDVHRGCAGFNYDCEESKKFTANFRDQIRRIYGSDSQVVFPVLVGVETDDDVLILHGDNGEVVDMSSIGDRSEEGLKQMIRRLFPGMPERIILDILPIIQGNIEQIGETKRHKEEAQLVHGEWVLAVGKGFDWLHTPNLALIVGPYDPNIGEPIKKAASIIKSNWDSGRIDKGAVVLASALYDDAIEKVRAQERSIFMKRLTENIISENYPEMRSYMNSIAVIVDSKTMKMEISA